MSSMPADPHAPHRAVPHQQPLHPAAGEQGDARRHRLLRIPAIELRAEQSEAGEALVRGGTGADGRLVGVRVGLEGQRGRGAFAGDGEDPLGDRPLPGRPLPEVGDELLGSRAVGHHPAEHVLCARDTRRAPARGLWPQPERAPARRWSRPGPAPTTMASKAAAACHAITQLWPPGPHWTARCLVLSPAVAARGIAPRLDLRRSSAGRTSSRSAT